MPNSHGDNDSNNKPLHDLTHNYVVDESAPMDHEKTQLQRDDEYSTISMGASQRMLASEYMDDAPAISSNSSSILTSHSLASSGAKVQASPAFESEIHARTEKEWEERQKHEEGH